MFILFASFLFLTLQASPTLGAGCNVPDSTTTLEPGTTFLIQNSEYPEPYTTKKSCTWTFIAPYASKLQISCPEIDLPKTSDCSTARLTIRTKVLCNEATYQLTDAGTQIKINFVSSAGVGKFKCQITSEVDMCNCGAVKTTATDKYPSLAVLTTPKNNASQCGAVLISNRFALASAVCVASASVTAAKLVVGRHQAGVTNSYAVETFIPHENYAASKSYHNLALVKTKLSIALSVDVGIACLPYMESGYAYNSLVDESVESVGYGPNPSGTTPKSVFVSPMQLVTQSFSVCKGGLGEICSAAVGETLKDACLIYDGYPLYIVHPTLAKTIVLGVKTDYRNCKTSTIFIDILLTANTDWIESLTKNYNYCKKYILPK